MIALRSRAVLIVNPNAGAARSSTRRDVLDALRARFQVEAYATTARDTGITIAQDAARAGAELVIAYGGDGHVNEVANGLASSDTALGIIPGGTMNAFARALGVPLDPLAAVGRLARSLDGPPRRVHLGRMDGRYFAFCAGCGFDAEAADRVGRYVPAKRRFGELFYYWSAVRVLAGTYRRTDPVMRLKGDFGEADVAMAIVSKTGPYAYLFGRPVEVAPKVRLDGGIDVFALRRMRLGMLPAYAARTLSARDLTAHADVFYAHDLDGLEVTSERPFLRHVDGEALAPARAARFGVERDVLLVRA